MVTPELQQRFRELLVKCDESFLEYEETHGDAGNGYIYCVLEDRIYARNRLKEYIKENMPEVTPDELKAILKALDQWAFDMEPGHRFTTIPAEKGCCLNSFSVEEVENQYEVSVLAEELDCDPEDIRAMVQAEKEKHEFCIGTLYREDFDTFCTYQCTDACWFAVLPREWIVDTLQEIRDNSHESVE